MEEKGLISLELKKGLIGNKKVIQINEDKFNNIINEIKSQILGKENLTEDIILLSSLLSYSRFLKNIFNKYEKDVLDERLKEINDTQISKNMKVARSVIGNMYALTTAIIVNSTSNH